MEESKLFGIESLSRTGTPLSAERHEESTGEDGWQKLNSSFETATSTTPDVSDYFSFLYGLYPINFLLFIREPYKFLERVDYKDIDHLDIEEETIRQRTELYRQRHILHPNFLTLTAETELSDQSRWMKVEPADITAQCIGLVNNSTPADDYRKSIRSISKPALPDALLPIEDIPTESLLSQEEEGRSTHGDVGGHNWRESDSISSTYASSVNARPKLYSLFPRPNTATPSRGEKTPDSPTIPPATTFDSTGEAHVQDMLKLQEQLQASLQDSASKKDGRSPPYGMLPRPPAGQAPTYPNSLTASPRLDAYAQSLNQNNAPRSPALRPAASDAHETISYLQREVMLLKNDLNFERYLKQQHLSHIGHLQRKHIKESTAEAETQNLINTNKTLKAKLEEAKKAYSASRQEALKSKNQAKKWEAELSAKIRTLREEQKAWRQDEESTKKALEAAKEETDHLQKLLTESEAEGLRSRQKLQSLRAEMEEINKLRNFVDHLSKKLSEYEDRSEQFEMQRHSEEDALSQLERMKLRLATREQEMQQMKRSVKSLGLVTDDMLMQD
jgi:solute carrier family 25 protein 16